jgi:hypothetical protein
VQDNAGECRAVKHIAGQCRAIKHSARSSRCFTQFTQLPVVCGEVLQLRTIHFTEELKKKTSSESKNNLSQERHWRPAYMWLYPVLLGWYKMDNNNILPLIELDRMDNNRIQPLLGLNRIDTGYI